MNDFLNQITTQEEITTISKAATNIRVRDKEILEKENKFWKEETGKLLRMILIFKNQVIEIIKMEMGEVTKQTTTLKVEIRI